MADYREILDSEIDAESPFLASLIAAIARNPEAITEGATGAPRIVDAALDTTVTSEGESWVGNRMAGLGSQGIGAHALLRNNSASLREYGQTLGGSSLTPASGGGGTSGSARSGTWMCLGVAESSAAQANSGRVTVWKRIA